MYIYTSYPPPFCPSCPASCQHLQTGSRQAYLFAFVFVRACECGMACLVWCNASASRAVKHVEDPDQVSQ